MTGMKEETTLMPLGELDKDKCLGDTVLERVKVIRDVSKMFVHFSVGAGLVLLYIQMLNTGLKIWLQ